LFEAIAQVQEGKLEGEMLVVELPGGARMMVGTAGQAQLAARLLCAISATGRERTC
jgi:hypothetical protein